jgi:hypothetical protein
MDDKYWDWATRYYKNLYDARKLDQERRSMMDDTVTALQARHLRLRIGKPLAEVDRLWQLESSSGFDPHAPVPFSKVGESVDYAELERLENIRKTQLGKD